MPEQDDEEGEGPPMPTLPDGSPDYDKIEEEFLAKFPPRELTEEEEAIVGELWKRKCAQTDFEAVERGDPILPTHAYVTTNADLILHNWNGHHPVEENTTEVTVPAFSTLKIVMVSRFQDFGLTDDLDAQNGYQIRIPFNDARIVNLRWTP